MERKRSFRKKLPVKRSPPTRKKTVSESSTSGYASPKLEDCLLYEACAFSDRMQARENSGNKLLCPFHFKHEEYFKKLEEGTQAMNKQSEVLRARWEAEGSRSLIVSEELHQDSANQKAACSSPAKYARLTVMDPKDKRTQEMKEYLAMLKLRWAAEDEAKARFSGTANVSLQHDEHFPDIAEDEADQ